jgi:hypothetical protein
VEPAASAHARGAGPRAAVLGAGGAFAPQPARGRALEQATAAALREAGLAPAAITRRVAASVEHEVALGAGGARAVLQALADLPGPTLVTATDPLGGAAALVLGPAPDVA